MALIGGTPQPCPPYSIVFDKEVAKRWHGLPSRLCLVGTGWRLVGVRLNIPGLQRIPCAGYLLTRT